VRATMGSVFSMPLIRAGVAEFLQWQKTSGTTMVATHLKGAIDYRKADYKTRPVVLLMGNEQAGLPDELAAAAGTKVRIPQQGRADSLNLAIATAVMLFEARRHLLDLAGIDD
jgi:TrmH family RNA methyltransferase